jgi:hypothetical protein
MKSEVELKVQVGPDIYMSVEYGTGTRKFLEALARDTGDSIGEAVRRSLGIYRLCIDAKRAGKFVGIAESAEDLEQEFVGFRWVTGDGAGERKEGASKGEGVSE